MKRGAVGAVWSANVHGVATGMSVVIVVQLGGDRLGLACSVRRKYGVW